MIFKIKVLKNHAEHKRRFVKGELHADACPLAVAKRFVCVRRNAVHLLEPFRPEPLGIFSPDALIPVQFWDEHCDALAFRNQVFSPITVSSFA